MSEFSMNVSVFVITNIDTENINCEYFGFWKLEVFSASDLFVP
jgi:hypothetical protein